MNNSNRKSWLKLNSRSDLICIEFNRIFGMDYFDGYESGIGICSNGACFRFNTLGDSYARLHRCFQFSIIDNIWCDKIQFITSVLDFNSIKNLKVSDNIEQLTSFAQQLNSVVSKSIFLVYRI